MSPDTGSCHKRFTTRRICTTINVDIKNFIFTKVPCITYRINWTDSTASSYAVFILKNSLLLQQLGRWTREWV